MLKALFSIFIIMLSLSPVAAQNAPKNRYGGTLIWGVWNKPTTFSPFFSSSGISVSLLDLIFNRLVRINPKGEIEPDLALSWDISEGGLIYTFYLKKGVKFHDGKECTAFDAKFTYEKLLDPKTGSPFREHFLSVKEFNAPDKYTFQVVLKEPSVSFIYRLMREITPKHLLEKVDLRSCYFNIHPVGTGPFKFKDWTKDGEVILEYNPDYFEGRPYLDKIIVKTYSDSREIWTALMRQEIDLALFISQEDYEIAKNDPAFKAYAFPFDAYFAISYNLEDPILSDKRIREAIARSIDRKNLIEKIASGYGLECRGPFYPDSLGFNKEVVPLVYSLEKARQLLREVGWIELDKDGVLQKEGKLLEFNLLIDERNEILKRIAMFIRQELQSIGIKVTLKFYDDENMLTEQYLEDNNIQGYLNMFWVGIDPDQQREDWNFNQPKRADKLWVYKNWEINRLFEEGKRTLEIKKREAIYRKIHQLVYEEQLTCFLYLPFIFHAASSKFSNVDSFFNINMPTYSMKDWFIENKTIDGRNKHLSIKERR